MIDQSIQAPESKLSAFNGVIVTFETRTERGNVSFEKFDDSRNNLNKKKKDRSIFCTIIQHLTKDDDWCEKKKIKLRQNKQNPYISYF